MKELLSKKEMIKKYYKPMTDILEDEADHIIQTYVANEIKNAMQLGQTSTTMMVHINLFRQAYPQEEREQTVAIIAKKLNDKYGFSTRVSADPKNAIIINWTEE